LDVKSRFKFNSFQRAIFIFMLVLGFLGLVVAPIAGLGMMALSLFFLFYPKYMSQLRPITLVLTQEGIERIGFKKKSVHVVPWKDIDSFAVITHSKIGQYIGIRLKKYDGYLSSIDSRVNHESFWGKLYKLMNPHYENILLYTRKKYGYEVMIMNSELDRSISEFVELLEQYRQAFDGNIKKF
jgi:hypothetical protein